MARGIMIFEMHYHTAEHSGCSTVSAAEIAQQNFNMGLQGTVFTDHHYLWPPDEIKELRRGLKVPDYYLLLSGQEVTTPVGLGESENLWRTLVEAEHHLARLSI